MEVQSGMPMKFETLTDSPAFRSKLEVLGSDCSKVETYAQNMSAGAQNYCGSLEVAMQGLYQFCETFTKFANTFPEDPQTGAQDEHRLMLRFEEPLRNIVGFQGRLHAQVDLFLGEKLEASVSSDLGTAKVLQEKLAQSSKRLDSVQARCDAAASSSDSNESRSKLEAELAKAQEQCDEVRFDLMKTLKVIEAKKNFEFLEAFSSTMDAHLKFFQQSYEQLKTVESTIQRLVMYSSQQRTEMNVMREKLVARVAVYCQGQDADSPHDSGEGATPKIPGERGTPKGLERIPSSGPGSARLAEMTPKTKTRSHQSLVASQMDQCMKSNKKHNVVIREGRLWKRSSNMRGDWKARYFVLDARGLLYYYRTTGSDAVDTECFPGAAGLLPVGYNVLLNKAGKVIGSAANRSTSLLSYKEAQRTVDLLTSTIKLDAEDTSQNFCFRIISPSKTYTFKAESEVMRMEWVEAIQAAIATLLSQPTARRATMDDLNHSALPVGGGSIPQSPAGAPEPKNLYLNSLANFSLEQDESQSVLTRVRRVRGNDRCADCGACDPEWVSINLAVVICIQCSSIHRRLGVHISKVRSLTLDVKVWEAKEILDLFLSTGNRKINEVWEGGVFREETESAGKSLGELEEGEEDGESSASSQEGDSSSRPSASQDLTAFRAHPDDSLPKKEQWIVIKYIEKRFVKPLPPSIDMWSVALGGDLVAMMRFLATSSDPHSILTSGMAVNATALTNHVANTSKQDNFLHGSGEAGKGAMLVHAAAVSGQHTVLELLLQNRAQPNALDSHGRSPLHWAIIHQHDHIAKSLVNRWKGSPGQKDEKGMRAMDFLMMRGSVSDDELLICLTNYNQ